MLPGILKFIERHFGVLLFSAAGLLFGWGVPGAFLGAALGVFLDSLMQESLKLRAARAFLLRGRGSALDDQEKKELAVSYLWFRILDWGGLPRELFREKQEALLSLELLTPGMKGRFVLDRARRIAGDTLRNAEGRDRNGNPEAPEAEGRAIRELNFYLTPGEKETFLRLAAGTLSRGEAGIPAPELRAVFALIIAAWGIPRESFPEIWAPAGNGGEDGNPWLLLGLSPGAPEEEIRKNYRLLAAQFHPDTMAELSEDQKKQAGEAFMRINRAYNYVTGKNDG